MTIKDSKYVKIYSLNSLYLFFKYMNGYFEEINGNRYLKLVPTNKNKEKIQKYGELWVKIGHLIRSITSSNEKDFS